MSGRWRPLATAVCIVALGLPGIANAARHALLIGVSNYTDRRVPDLEGPRHDVAALQAVLVARWGFAPGDVTVLLDADASERAILAALRRLQDIPPGDEILVYFSGHGTSASDPELGGQLNLPDGTGAIAASDFDPDRIDRLSLRQPADDGLLVGRYELRPAFEALDRSHPMLVIFDACFSGNAARARPSPWRPRQVRQLSLLDRVGRFVFGKSAANADTEDGQSASGDSAFIYRNTVYFGAAAESQLAVDFSQAEIDAGIVSSIDGKPHGGFTDALLRALSSYPTDSGPPTRARLFNRLRHQFARYCRVCGHDPVSLPAVNPPGSDVLDRTFLAVTGAPPATPREAGDEALRIAASETARTSLPRALASRLDPASSRVAPDLYFEQDGTELRALDSDGALLTSFQRTDAGENRLDAFADARAWLKQRSVRDARQASGDLRVGFRHPVLGMTVHEGDLLEFELQYPRNASIALFLLDASGALSVLYPATASEAEATLRSGELFHFPRPGEPAIAVTPPWGADTLLFYALPTGHAYQDTLLALAERSPVSPADPALVQFESWLDGGAIDYGALQLRIAAEP